MLDEKERSLDQHAAEDGGRLSAEQHAIATALDVNGAAARRGLVAGHDVAPEDAPPVGREGAVG